MLINMHSSRTKSQDDKAAHPLQDSAPWIERGDDEEVDQALPEVRDRLTSMLRKHWTVGDATQRMIYSGPKWTLAQLDNACGKERS